MTDKSKTAKNLPLSEENRRLYESVSSPWDEFREHPGQVARLRWDLLQDFYQDVVRVNGVKLIVLSELPQIDKKVWKKLLRKASVGQEVDYTGEIARLLYNYVTSAATLADHCRYVMKNYENTEFYSEYEEKISDFKNMPETVFLKDLRNYFAHHKIPSIGLSIGHAKQTLDDFRHEALIYTSDLFDGDKWSARSIRYINDHFPYVYIAGLIKIHLAALADLYSWIFSNFMRLHGEEYAVSLKVKERIISDQL